MPPGARQCPAFRQCTAPCGGLDWDCTHFGTAELAPAAAPGPDGIASTGTCCGDAMHGNDAGQTEMTIPIGERKSGAAQPQQQCQARHCLQAGQPRTPVWWTEPCV